MARACQKVEGFWVGLWHPNLVPALGFPDAVEEYRRLVQVIIQERPYIAPLHTIVNWRKARRSVHALGVSADGAVTFRAGTPSVWPLIIEDSRGTVVSQLPWPQAA